MKRLLNIIVLSTLLVSCRPNDPENNTPIKKPNIPDKAFWVGGVDGGNWYLVKYIHDHKNNAFIDIYNDKTGDLILSKKFFVVCIIDNPTWIDDLKTQIISFDGKKILLRATNGKKNCWLQ